MINSILKDTHEELVASAYLDGEYGLRDMTIGVPCKIGRGGIEKILELELSEKEDAAFRNSAKAIKNSIDII
jgi:malate dehydrogenase